MAVEFTCWNIVLFSPFEKIIITTIILLIVIVKTQSSKSSSKFEIWAINKHQAL